MCNAGAERSKCYELVKQNDMSKWTGGGADSWFDYDRLSKYRKLINPEKTQKLIPGCNIFYLLSVDVGRISCQTVVSVFKVFIHDDSFDINLVNMYIIGKDEKNKHFARQAIALKKLIEAYNAKEIVIDSNGIGAGLMDFMVIEQLDEETGEYYPAYCSVNKEEYRHSLYPNAKPIVYCIKSNNTLESQINGNCYSKIFTGKVQFLVPEQQIKSKLLSTKKGQKMSIEKRVARVLPHELTTILFTEMANFRLRQTGSTTDIKLEKINSKMLSDKYSSFAYGLWRIKELEDEYYKKIRRKSKRNRKLVFFTSGR